MMFERKIVVGLDDISAISLECAGCRRRITFNADTPIGIPEFCSCGHPWRSHESDLKHPATTMLEAISTMRTLRKHNKQGFSLLLMFDEPSK